VAFSSWRFEKAWVPALRFDFYGDESGNEAVATKKGSYEMRGDGVEIQISAAKAVYSASQVDTTS